MVESAGRVQPIVDDDPVYKIMVDVLGQHTIGNYVSHDQWIEPQSSRTLRLGPPRIA
jgi:hypothetical protein